MGIETSPKWNMKRIKKLKKNDSIAGLCVNFIQPNIHILGVPKGEKGEETKIFGENVWKFSKLNENYKPTDLNRRNMNTLYKKTTHIVDT